MTTTIINGAVVPTYPTLADFPISAPFGALAVAIDSNILYEFNSVTLIWTEVGSGGGGSGTVTSVALTASPIFTVSGSPVTTAGTIDLELANEPANFIFAGPTSGSDATPTFRALTVADLPAGTSDYAVNEFTLSSGNISSKSVTLTTAPTNPSLTLLNVIGGPIQQYGTDFTVSGNVLSWSSLFLDGILISGDNLIVQFY